MGQKINPNIFRIQNGNQFAKWNFTLFRKKNDYHHFCFDILVSEYINSIRYAYGILSFACERNNLKIKVELTSIKPSLIIGKNGENIPKIQNNISKLLSIDLNKNAVVKKLINKMRHSNLEQVQKIIDDLKITNNLFEVNLNIRESRTQNSSPDLIAKTIAQGLESRQAYKRLMTQSINKLSSDKTIKGALIIISGRLNGAEIARRDKASFGSLSLHTLSSNILSADATAKTTYGIIGIKVYICLEKSKDKINH